MGCKIHSLFTYIGMVLGVNNQLLEIRRVRSGILTEEKNMVSLYDLVDAIWLFNKTKDESYIRRVIMPLEVLLLNRKRLIVRDSAVSALCYGAELMSAGLLGFDRGIEIGDEIVAITLKGEAIGVCIAKMNTITLSRSIHGIVAKIKRVIMDRNTYPKRWRSYRQKTKKK
jgi:H/ACA ribonucleoprotein complex subunit 4